MNYLFLIIILVIANGCDQKPQAAHYTEEATEDPSSLSHSDMQDALPPGHPSIGENALPPDHLPIGDMGSVSLPSVNADSSLVWTVPANWIEKPGKGMRVATFQKADDPQAIDCSIVTLGGEAGGIEANLSRWMGQLGIQPSAENLQKLVATSQGMKTQDGQEVKVYNFADIQEGISKVDKSAIAAIISTPAASIFVKMTGGMEAIHQNRNSFEELIKSLRHK
jgi:hypothetical protein